MMSTLATSSRTYPAFTQCVARAYAVFCLFALLISIASFISQDINAAIRPFMMWNGEMFYAQCLIFFVLPLKPPRYLNFLRIARTFLILAIVFGVVDLFNKGPFGPALPMLYHHPLRPLFPLALPLAWLALITVAIFLGAPEPEPRPPARPLFLLTSKHIGWIVLAIGLLTPIILTVALLRLNPW